MTLSSMISCNKLLIPQLFANTLQLKLSVDCLFQSNVSHRSEVALLLRCFFCIRVGDYWNRIAFWRCSRNITRTGSSIGDCYGCRQEGSQSDRQARRQPRADAPNDAGDESGEARRRVGPHLPAGAEIREGHQPDRGEPAAADLPHPAGAGG